MQTLKPLRWRIFRFPDPAPAILADAVSTPFGAVGGVGTHSVQLARLVGAAPIIAFEMLAKLVSPGRLDLSRSISRIIGLEEIQDGIDALDSADGNPIRILVAP